MKDAEIMNVFYDANFWSPSRVSPWLKKADTINLLYIDIRNSLLNCIDSSNQIKINESEKQKLNNMISLFKDLN